MFAARNVLRQTTSNHFRSQVPRLHRRLLSSGKDSVKEESTKVQETAVKEGWWTSVDFWAKLGAAAGWGMSGSAIYDSLQSGPERISMNMTTVLVVYSSLFTRWAIIVSPPNYALAACHATNVFAQLNQLRRSLEYKLETGMKEEVEKFAATATAGAVAGAACLVAGPKVRTKLMAANLGVLTTIAAWDAGPFTVHFWAPMSKWLISGASFLDLHRPTELISIPQYSALTATGLFFSRYAMLVVPLNPMLCAVNVALFGSSAWHLGRKVNADYIQDKEE